MLILHRQFTAWLCTAVLLCLGSVHGICDVCGVRYEHIKDYSTPFEDGGVFPTCSYYKDAACCSADTVDMIDKGYAIYDGGEEKYSWNACNTDDPDNIPKMSAACEAFFKAQACFYECDVNIAKYRKHTDCQFDGQTGESQNGWQLFAMPIKSSYCDDWYQACKDDYFCYDAANMNSDWFSHPPLHHNGECTEASGNCKTYETVFGQGGAVGGEGICEMWSGAFVYTTEGEAYVMNFTGTNPNDAVHTTVAPADPCPDHDVSEEGRDSACGADAAAFPDLETTPCEVCHLRNDHTKDVALPEGLEGVCSKYSDNSCCTAEIAQNIQDSAGLYGPEYRWEKCYFYHQGLNDTLTANETLSAKFDECNRWFQEEECLYECDVNAGKWRKHETCFGEDNSQNAWQIEGMPLKASECDAFYEACKDLVMCACTEADCPEGASPKSLFGLAASDSLCRDSTQFCTKTIGQVWANGTEWCEMLWDGSFVYEEHEAKAYSMVWNATGVDKSTTDTLTVATFDSNPNDLVYTELTWPEPCNFTDATVEMCDSDGNVSEEQGADGSSDTTDTSATPGAEVTETSSAPAASGMAHLLAALVAVLALLW